MTTNNTMLLESSNEEPTLKQVAPRAPKQSSSRARILNDFHQLDEEVRKLKKKFNAWSFNDITEEELADLPPHEEPTEVVHHNKLPIVHNLGECNHMSLCAQCCTMRKTIKIMHKTKDRLEELVEQYYMSISKMSTHNFCIRTTQDSATFANQNVYMRAQFVRGLGRYTSGMSKYRTKLLRDFMIPDDDNKQHTIERTRARDLKYETAFMAEGLGPIQHARGDCSEQFSMCEDCISMHKCYSMGKQISSRLMAGYGLFWRILETLPSPQARAIASDTVHYINTYATSAGVQQMLTSNVIYSEELGPNYSEKSSILEALRKKRDAFETPFKAQAFASIDLNIPTLDRITETLNRLITHNNIAVDTSVWARRMTSFVLMLMQLCAQSTVFIKLTAVAQFLTHFDLPGLTAFRGYAQQLAQVFQTAVERIQQHGRGDLYEQLTDVDDDEQEHIYDADTEGPFRAQGDEPRAPEGLLVGTAKLFCAMAGVTDYDIKANAGRISRIDQLSRTIVSTERLAQFIGKLFKYAYEAAAVHVFGVHPDMRELQMVSEKIPKWMDTVTDYYNNEGLNRVTKNIDDARKVLRWHKEGDEYNALLWKFKVVPKAYAIFKNVYNMCDRLYQAGAPYLSESAMRVSPFVILITGGPGLGKSVMQYNLITDIMRDAFEKRGLVYKPGEQVHVHTSGQKHWDGYNEQSVVVVDDIFQSMDPAETIEQCMDLCRMKNMVSWPVAKADLASKGNTFMVSELLVMTGNVAVPHDITKVIRSYDAIRRRIDMLVTHKVVEKYLDESHRLDKVKVSRDFPITYSEGLPIAADITSIFRFDVLDNHGRKILADGTYTQLVQLAIGMKKWEKDHEEGVIRANYIRAGLTPTGVEPRLEHNFVAQMWSNIMNRPPVNKYEGDLLFEEDVALIQAILNPDSPQQQSPIASGFLTEEERLEIFATISQNHIPDPTWSERMRDVYNHVKRDVSTAAKRFGEVVASSVDKIRESMTGSLMFKVGALVTVAVSIVTLGFLSYKLMTKNMAVPVANNDTTDGEFQQTHSVLSENTSGDEKTRQTRTKFVDARAQGEVITREMHGKKWIAVATTRDKTVWIPEAKIGNRKPLVVRDQLWTDDETQLPHDVMSQQPDGTMVAQACPDRNAYNLGINRVTNNSVVAQITENSVVISRLRGLFVYGRVLMTPLHLFYGLDMTNVSVEIINSHGLVQTFNTNECELLVPPDMDVIFLRLPKRFQCYSDIRSHFHTMDSVNKYQLSEAMLWIVDGENNGKLVTLCDNITKDSILDYGVVSHKGEDSQIHIIKSYVYRGVTLAGYCGAPLIWINPSVQGGHILGIHVAGSNLRGLTTPITREFLYSFLKKWDDISIKVPDLDPLNGVMVAQSKRAISKDTKLAHYGRVSPCNQVRIPSTTNIIPSPLHGIFEPVTGPAMLSPTKTVNPLRSGIQKQCVPLVIFPERSVELAVAHLKNSILSVDTPYKWWERSKILTAKEALNGIPGDLCIPPMNLHTSPGYPYINSNTSKNGKFDFVSGEPGDRELHEIVVQKLEQRLKEAKNREISMTLFVDILKDERVKLEKIPIGKTRIFNVAPFDLNIAVRMYFQVFAAHVMHNHVYGECAVGINPHSDEWGLMYHHMEAPNTVWIGGDYSNYDKQLSYQLLKAVLEIIESFYEDDNANIRECLFDTMFSAFHLAERDVYRVPQGNPSGIVMTSLVNSLVNSLMMRIIYIELGGNLSTFTDNIRLKTYGDDNIASVSTSIPWFNMVSISKKFAEYGIVYNQPNKQAMDANVPYLSTTDITFLKRGFRKQDGRIMAPLNMDSIREMLNWIRASNDDVEATRANFLAACREMYHHGRDEFDKFVKYVYIYAQKHAFLLPYTDYVTSGQYWGAESADHVNFTAHQTTQVRSDCCDLEYEETLFSAQSERAPRKIKAVWQLLCELLIITAITISTPNTELEPTESTSGPEQLSNTVMTRNQITSFTDTSNVTMMDSQCVPPVPQTPIDPYMKQDLIGFISRTYYETYEWSAALPPGTLLGRIRFPNFLLSFPPIWDKLKNYTYFRAGVKVSIRINGTKFHYGQLLVSWSPNGKNIGDLETATNNMYSHSGNPCFMLSPSENEVHEFTLPYALPNPTAPLYQYSGSGDPAYDIGVVSLWVLNPLSSASSPSSISYTIFANFVDVDIAGYQAVSYSNPTRFFEDSFTSSIPTLYPEAPIPPDNTSTLEPMPPFVEVFRAQADTEQTAKSSQGIVSTALEAASTLAGTLSAVPAISTVARGASMALGLASQVARAFGYSKPLSIIAPHPMIQRYSVLANTHGLSDATNLSIYSDGKVGKACDKLGGCRDEMSLLYIAQTPTLLCAGISWQARDTANSLLYQTDVSPAAEYRDSLAAYPTLLSWVTRSCTYWRGSIRYHFQIVCSQMHVGRLRISYVPKTAVGVVPTGFDSTQNANIASIVVDIQQQTSISFSVPYLHDQAWSTIEKDGREQLGFLRVSVLNPLNHPQIPVPSVYINVWVSAGPDFQWARPDITNTRVTGYNVLIPGALEEEEETPFQAQGLTREQIASIPAPPIIPAAGSREENLCMTDEVHHIKDMIMRPGFVQYVENTQAPLAGYTQTSYRPFAPVVMGSTAGTPANTFRDYFRLIFRYSRGSVTYGSVKMNVGGSLFDASSCMSHGFTRVSGPLAGDDFRTFASNPILTPPNAYQNYLSNGMHVTELITQPCVASMPYNATTYGFVNMANILATTNTYGSCRMYAAYPTAVLLGRYQSITFNSAGDDYELVYLVGPPALKR